MNTQQCDMENYLFSYLFVSMEGALLPIQKLPFLFLDHFMAFGGILIAETNNVITSLVSFLSQNIYDSLLAMKKTMFQLQLIQDYKNIKLYLVDDKIEKITNTELHHKNDSQFWTNFFFQFFFSYT